MLSLPCFEHEGEGSALIVIHLPLKQPLQQIFCIQSIHTAESYWCNKSATHGPFHEQV